MIRYAATDKAMLGPGCGLGLGNRTLESRGYGRVVWRAGDGRGKEKGSRGREQSRQRGSQGRRSRNKSKATKKMTFMVTLME